jgi:hypothetical protein
MAYGIARMANCIAMMGCGGSLSVDEDNTWQTAISQKKAYSHLLTITRDTRNRDREKSLG